jgi:dipeptidyl aminopeptidase/acylaminoacyl peptidase
MRADGAGKPQALTHSKNMQVPSSFTADGSRLAYVEFNRASGADLWTLSVERDGESLRAGEPQIFLKTPYNERAPAFSPDGRWLAYSSDETGIIEVYVREYPDHGGKIQISNGGGNFPIWSRDGNRLFCTNGDRDNQLMIASYTLRGNSFRPEKAHLWSEIRLPFAPPSRSYDVARDGQRAIAVLPAHGQENETAQRHVVFLEHFLDELRRRDASATMPGSRVFGEP